MSESDTESVRLRRIRKVRLLKQGEQSNTAKASARH